MNIVSSKNKLIKLFSLTRREFGAYKIPVICLGILSFISGILEGIGINAIIPLFSFISGNNGTSADSISQVVEKLFHFFHLPYSIKSLLIFIIILFLVKAFVSFITSYISVKIVTNYQTKTRSELFGLMLRADWPFLSQQKMGHLEQVLTTDITNSSVLLSNVTSITVLLANLLVYMLIAVNISYFIAILTLVVGVVVFLMFKPLFYRNRIFSEQIEKMYKQMAHFVSENMYGMKTVKSMAVEFAVKKEGDRQFSKIRDLNMRMDFVRNISNTVLQPIGLIFIIAIFSFFYKLTAFNFASFAVIVYAINKVFAYIQLAQAQLHGATSLIPYVMSIDRYRIETNIQKEKDSGNRDFIFKSLIEFKNVGFSYTEDMEILSGVSFTVKKGEMVGIIGPSGAGKTTVVDLLLRLLNPRSGAITLDGRNITDVKLADWRAHIGYVSQDMYLINDTIENNIKFYNPMVSHEDVILATKLANIYDFVDRQPMRFATVIGERGILISGGEKQRIILARILARKPEIIVLDEATSALDNESEALIQKSIENLKGNCTIIIIAHRLSTIMTVDRLIALESGKVREQGIPQKLLKEKDSYFFKVYNVR